MTKIGMEALQKRKYELRGVGAVRRQDKKRYAHDHADEYLEVDFLLRREPQIALLGDFCVVIDESDDRKTD